MPPMPFLAPVLAVLIIAAGAAGYVKGSASRNDEIAELQGAIRAAEIAAKDAAIRAENASARVVVEYRDRVKTITERLPGEIQLVEIIRKDTSLCPLPGAFRELWNGGSAPHGADAQAASGVDAAPVPVADLAETVIEARKRFDENAARLNALQDWINSQ